MLNPNKEANTLKLSEMQLGQCPICNKFVSQIYFMQDSKTKKQSKWYSCACGVVWNERKPDMIYDHKYIDKYDKFDKKLKDAFEYPVRIYAPLIEELVYGRKVLLIGRTTTHQESFFAQRGWIPYSIDKNTSLTPTDRLFCGDFESYQFPQDVKFNLIWIYHTLECFLDPAESLSKIKSLLTEDGILFVASPDTDFIHTRGSSGFIHWKPDMNFLMWNRRSLTSHLEKLGLNLILARQNYEHRFPAWDDLHILAQKKYF